MIMAHMRTALRFTGISVVLLGFVYPAIVTGLAYVLCRPEARGSLLSDTQGRVIGSALAGQVFTKPEYFHGRPSAAGTGYDPLASSGTNLGPTSKKLLAATHTALAQTMRDNQTGALPPADLVSASASGLDPDISPAAADYQVARVAHARNRSPETVAELVRRTTSGRDFGIFGEPRVNVLQLNLALDAQTRR